MKWIWEPSQEWIEAANVWRFLRRLGLRDREEFLRYSTSRIEEFWARMVEETGIAWFEPYSQVLDQSRGIEHLEVRSPNELQRLLIPPGHQPHRRGGHPARAREGGA